MFRLWQNALLEKVNTAQLLPLAWGGCISSQNVFSPWVWALWIDCCYWAIGQIQRSPRFLIVLEVPHTFSLVVLTWVLKVVSPLTWTALAAWSTAFIDFRHFSSNTLNVLGFILIRYDQTHRHTWKWLSVSFYTYRLLKEEACHAMWGNTRVSQEAKRAWGQHGQELLLWFSQEVMCEAG